MRIFLLFLMYFTLLAMIGDSIYTISTKRFATRSGRPVSEDEAMIIGIMLLLFGIIMLISLLYGHLTGQFDNDKMKKNKRKDESNHKINSVLIKCPFCRKEKEVSEYGRYKCKKCRQKFEVRPDGTIVRISKI